MGRLRVFKEGGICTSTRGYRLRFSEDAPLQERDGFLAGTRLGRK